MVLDMYSVSIIIIIIIIINFACIDHVQKGTLGSTAPCSVHVHVVPAVDYRVPPFKFYRYTHMHDVTD